mmetsp:Transcript_63307/g.187123  ORF Transcript_63307/g.187123 Transcript_63307/m.187123 type:complete len:196 (-) Transcript_63307:81-668(-)|eukprot:CAMPEP_0113562868 /NCGR_PEP_ID=MMETSP0015_2-20120614/20755_1 /TAXON_ID=2838 /ORGANISM="Odontella" /LENGTH=195 /DNA_ID=CAMNT_0000464791 /DNA_START=89 /DNA_END=676 /DNA_ORIENTATION=- /assembly_acc=CAM_ASM_000160
MSAICIGGVCVPYTAVLPLLALALRWLATQLAALGVLPGFVAKKLGIETTETSTVTSPASESSPSGLGESQGAQTKIIEGDAASVKEIDTVEGWNAELSSSSQGERPVVAKFTASWCKPCKAIDPFYRDLATRYEASFVKIDVDEMDEVAAECKVAMMPTFVVFRGNERKGSISGANEDRLERLIQEHCPRKVRT